MAYRIKFENGQEFDINGFSIVGRNPDSSILEGAQLCIVEDPTKTISKTHAALAVDGSGQLMIEDLETTNGTFIAGEGEFETQVFNGDPKVLQAGNRVRLGEAFFDVLAI